VLGLAGLGAVPAAAAGRPATVPALRSFEPAGGHFTLPRSPRVVATDARLSRTADVFAADLRALSGRRVRVARAGAARSGDLVLRLGARDRRLGREGYTLAIGAAVVVRARTPAGAFYATRTLLQLLRGRGRISAGVARDWPSYAERGLMVDVGRKPFSLAWLRSRIRELAYLKLNQLHLHLTDHEGWRLASARHPEVVTPPALSRAQVRSLVRFAARHHVRVVPEIDMPGHMRAALRRHPELQLADADGRRLPGALDVSSAPARRLARELVEEALPLFPAPYWHMGADEYLGIGAAGEDRYDRYPQLRAFARARHGPRANGKDAVLSFVVEMERLVRRHGKTLRMWHDGLGGGRAVSVPSRVVVEWWTDGLGPSPGELLARSHRVLNAGWFPTYYVVGPAGRRRPDLRAAYEGWAPNRFAGITTVFAPPGQAPPPVVVPAGTPGLLGSELHVWNDDPDGETEDEIAAGIAPRLRVLAQATWGSPRLTPSYARFAALARRLGSAPVTRRRPVSS
jgi:hexosaminidase